MFKLRRERAKIRTCGSQPAGKNPVPDPPFLPPPLFPLPNPRPGHQELVLGQLHGTAAAWCTQFAHGQNTAGQLHPRRNLTALCHALNTSLKRPKELVSSFSSHLRAIPMGLSSQTRYSEQEGQQQHDGQLPEVAATSHNSEVALPSTAPKDEGEDEKTLKQPDNEGWGWYLRLAAALVLPIFLECLDYTGTMTHRTCSIPITYRPSHMYSGRHSSVFHCSAFP